MNIWLPTRTGEPLKVPLRSRDSLLGLVEVTQYQREKAFFDDYEIVNEWQHDIELEPIRKVKVFCAGMPDDGCHDLPLVMCTAPWAPVSRPAPW